MRIVSLLLICLIMSSCAPAMACDSYEDCIDKARIYESKFPREAPKPEELSAMTSSITSLATQAIAYKLDEISKKLDKPTFEIKGPCTDYNGKRYYIGTTIEEKDGKGCASVILNRKPD